MNNKTSILAALGLLVLLLASCSHRKPDKKQITVFQFNIWNEGRYFQDGFNDIVNQLDAANADFVTLSEVRNLNRTRFCDRIVQALSARGKKYYSFYSSDSGLLSRYPIIDSTVVYPVGNDHGTVYRALIQMNDKQIALYTAHLDYLTDTYYDVRGYNGSTWRKQKPMTDVDSILAKNATSLRDDEIKAFISAAQNDLKQNRIVLLGGDFNEPSCLDWIAANKDLYDHHGLVIPWTCTQLLKDAGFTDSYRFVHPDPLTHPGFTFPAATPGKPMSQLAWAPDADERDRIDYVFYAPQNRIKATQAYMWGPDSSVCRFKAVKDELKDSIISSNGVWPSDHRAILIRFDLN